MLHGSSLRVCGAGGGECACVRAYVCVLACVRVYMSLNVSTQYCCAAESSGHMDLECGPVSGQQPRPHTHTHTHTWQPWLDRQDCCFCMPATSQHEGFCHTNSKGSSLHDIRTVMLHSSLQATCAMLSCIVLCCAVLCCATLLEAASVKYSQLTLTC